MNFYLLVITDKRRRTYDQGSRTNGFNDSSFHNARRNNDFDYEFGSFKFRTPEEVFREFFRGKHRNGNNHDIFYA